MAAGSLTGNVLSARGWLSGRVGWDEGGTITAVDGERFIVLARCQRARSTGAKQANVLARSHRARSILPCRRTCSLDPGMLAPLNQRRAARELRERARSILPCSLDLTVLAHVWFATTTYHR